MMRSSVGKTQGWMLGTESWDLGPAATVEEPDRGQVTKVPRSQEQASTLGAVEALDRTGARLLKRLTWDRSDVPPASEFQRPRTPGYILFPSPRLVPVPGIFSLPFRDWCPLR
eukprot:9497686-Pyramimonas_sp.AAC.1